jgi:RND family efflux transporter MFP subunit
MSWKFKLTSFHQGLLQVVLIIVVLVLGVASNFLLARSGKAPVQSARGPEALYVEVMQPERVTTTIRVVESGIVQSRNTVSLTPQVSGLVVEVAENLASGGVFEAGEVLFRLDPADFEADIDQLEAEVSSSKAKLELERAEADIARREWELVYADEPIPDLVARKPQIAQAEAALESSEARLRAVRLNLQRTSFSLPFAGRIVSTTVELGQRLVANQSYGKAYALDSLEISVSMDAEILEALEPVVGRRAVVERRGRRQTSSYPAVVTRVEAELDQATRLGRVIVGFTQQSPVIPGTFVSVEIMGPTVEGVFALPEQAVSESRVAWVVVEGRLQKRTLEFLGLSSDGRLLVAPFEVGQGIVTSPLVSPSESMPVRIINRGNQG